jgi:hypothetical protein
VAALAQVRRFALSLPGVTEEPHFDASSFRVHGKIFATVPPDGVHLHVFTGEGEIAASVAEDPGAFEPLVWGRRTRGLRVRLAEAPMRRVQELLEDSWRRRAPKRLVAAYDLSQAARTGGPQPGGRSPG